MRFTEPSQINIFLFNAFLALEIYNESKVLKTIIYIFERHLHKTLKRYQNKYIKINIKIC